MDTEIRVNGIGVAGIETKIGSSTYHPMQRLQDIWLDLNTEGGYPVYLVRKPLEW